MTRLDSEGRSIGIEDIARLAHQGEGTTAGRPPRVPLRQRVRVPRREHMHAPAERVRVRLAALVSSGSIKYQPAPAVL